MARLLKQRYTVTDGQGRKATRKSKKWYVEFRDGQGIRRRVPGFTDKAATQQLASELERNALRGHPEQPTGRIALPPVGRNYRSEYLDRTFAGHSQMLVPLWPTRRAKT